MFILLAKIHPTTKHYMRSGIRDRHPWCFSGGTLFASKDS